MKKKTISRTTISVPHELKKRMDKVSEPVNWSALACAAFEAKLNEIQKLQEVKTMSDVIARLRASKQQTESAEFNAGLQAGRDWAKQTAEFSELQNLARLRDQRYGEGSHSWLEFFDSNCGSSAFCTCDHLYFELNPEEQSRDSSTQFWETVVGDEPGPQSDEWVRGFAEGALAVFDEIADQL